MEQARQEDGGRGRQPRRFRQERCFAERVSRDDDVSEIVDDQIEALAAEARQHRLDVELARERTVRRVDDQRDAEPHEHHPPVAVMRGAKREQREHGPACGQEMHRRGAEPRVHADMV